MVAGGSGGGHGAKMLIAIDFLYTILYFISIDKKVRNKMKKIRQTNFYTIIPKCNDSSVGTPTLQSLHFGILRRCNRYILG
jgi:hypothetical protein